MHGLKKGREPKEGGLRAKQNLHVWRSRLGPQREPVTTAIEERV